MSDGSNREIARRDFLGVGAGVGLTALALVGPRAARATTLSNPNLVSVLDFGADPTGVNDSWQAIQDAINYAINPPAPAVVRGEAAVFFPNGKYKITDTLVIQGTAASTINNVSLIGMRASVVQTGIGKDIIRFQNTAHCMIKDLYLSGSTQTGNGITLINSVRTILENVEIYLVGGDCMYAEHSFWLSAYDCIFSLPGANHWAVRHVSNMNNVAYYHCRFSASTQNLDRFGLLHSEGGGYCLTLIGCDFSSNKIALRIHHGTNIHVANCYFEANEVGVQWGDVTAPNTYVWPISGTIDNCYFIDRSSSHSPVFIDVQSGINLRINNPFINGNGDVGVTGNSIGIRVHNHPNGASANQRIAIDDVPYMQYVLTRVDDPSHRLRRVTTQVWA